MQSNAFLQHKYRAASSAFVAVSGVRDGNPFSQSSAIFTHCIYVVCGRDKKKKKILFLIKQIAIILKNRSFPVNKIYVVSAVFVMNLRIIY